MLLIRTVENTFLDLFSQGRIHGTVHTCLGQEACAVGVVRALDRERDVIFSSHRAHGHFLAYCDRIDGLVAEVLGLPSGVCRGVGGTQHLHWRNLYTNGVQGGIVPAAVGAALAEKRRGSGAIVVVFIGDGTMGQGVVYESFNISSLWELPVLFVMEHNAYAQSTPTCAAHVSGLAHRASAFGIRTFEEDGNRVLAVYETAGDAAAFVRKRGKPAFLALDTYRLAPHSRGDDDRAPSEIDEQRKRDPLELAARDLTAAERERIGTEVAVRVADVFAGLLRE